MFLRVSIRSLVKMSSINSSECPPITGKRLTRSSAAKSSTPSSQKAKYNKKEKPATSSSPLLVDATIPSKPKTSGTKLDIAGPTHDSIKGNSLKRKTTESGAEDEKVQKTKSSKKASKAVKKSSVILATEEKSAEKNEDKKPELFVPFILIPQNKRRILRPPGVSPWNGTKKHDNKLYLGAHISAAGGLENAITNSLKIGGSSFALFLKNQRQWVAKPMEDSTVDRFKAACLEHKFPPHLILPHGSYLMNCGSSDPTILGKSRATLLDEVQRCERLGILNYNIHPGSSCGKSSREEAIINIADSINWVHDQTPNSQVAVVLENMCRQGNTIGGDLSEIAAIIERVFDQSRVGVCLDTCHALAAGYDLATSTGFDAFLEEFERVIGFKYLVAVHLNDSEGALGCHRDRHASIGKGHIGLEGFRRIINCPRFRDIPLVLETPFISDDYYKQEILLLKTLAESGTVCA